MKLTSKKPFNLYLSLSILAGTLWVILGTGLVTQAEATTERPVCSPDVAGKIEPIQRAARAIAEDPRQTVDIITSLVPGSDLASQIEPIQRAAEAIAEDPRQTVDIITSLVCSTNVDQTSNVD
jgi:hypothetical protein